ncbi:MAG: YcgN family cysteine cluster protein [Caulobacteraceae bacterium]
MSARPFWQAKSLAEMSAAEWESLCDGCGLCCLVRFEDEDTGEVTPTRVACRLFDGQACRCRDYEHRRQSVPDCIKLTPGNVSTLKWMPKSCAYRRLAEGRGLTDWHPLVSGDPESVHAAGVSIRGQTVSEADLADPDDALAYMAPDLLAERGRQRLARPRGASNSDPG